MNIVETSDNYNILGIIKRYPIALSRSVTSLTQLSLSTKRYLLYMLPKYSEICYIYMNIIDSRQILAYIDKDNKIYNFKCKINSEIYSEGPTIFRCHKIEDTLYISHILLYNGVQIKKTLEIVNLLHKFIYMDYKEEDSNIDSPFVFYKIKMFDFVDCQYLISLCKKTTYQSDTIVFRNTIDNIDLTVNIGQDISLRGLINKSHAIKYTTNTNIDINRLYTIKIFKPIKPDVYKCQYNNVDSNILYIKDIETSHYLKNIFHANRQYINISCKWNTIWNKWEPYLE